MTQDTKRLVVELAASKKEVLDEIFEYGELTATFRDVADRIIEQEGYTRQTVYDARIEQKKQARDDHREARDHHAERADELDDEIEELQRERANVLSKEDEYRGALKELERDLRREPTGPDDDTLTCIWATHPKVQGLADEYGKQADVVLDDLRDRNPDVPNEAFTEGVVSQSYRGLPPEQARLPVDERDAEDTP